MAAFPTYVKLGLGSSLDPEDKWDDSFSESRSQHSIKKTNTQYYGVSGVWPGATGQQFNDFMAVYDSVGRDAMTGFNYYLSSPTLTLSVKFTSVPRIITNHGGDKYTVGFSLRGS